MDDRTRGLIGLFGGLIALVGVFTPWVTFRMSIPLYFKMSESLSAWRFITESSSGMSWEAAGLGATTIYSSLALVGSGFVILGALYTLAGYKIKILWVILAIGGILGIVGAAWGLLSIDTDSLSTDFGSASIRHGFGLYLTLFGSIVGLIGNSRFDKWLFTTTP